MVCDGARCLPWREIGLASWLGLQMRIQARRVETRQPSQGKVINFSLPTLHSFLLSTTLLHTTHQASPSRILADPETHSNPHSSHRLVKQAIHPCPSPRHRHHPLPFPSSTMESSASLWVDKVGHDLPLLLTHKYRPRTLNDLHYHPELSSRLKSLASSGDFPHILFYGPSGAGKKVSE